MSARALSADREGESNSRAKCSRVCCFKKKRIRETTILTRWKESEITNETRMESANRRLEKARKNGRQEDEIGKRRQARARD